MSAKQPFGARLQFILIWALAGSLLLIAQSFTHSIYTIGFAALCLFVPLQVAIGNIKPEWGAGKSLVRILIYLLIVAVVFAISIAITPFLVNLGRVK
ncbi:MAG: hypothetical protein RLZZ251_52 [Actinomycetota bacterium]|mgnify:FL=1|jgi:hypothetical protein